MERENNEGFRDAQKSTKEVGILLTGTHGYFQQMTPHEVQASGPQT